MNNVYKIMYYHGSTVLQYTGAEHKVIFKSVRSAMKADTWKKTTSDENLKKFMISPEKAKKIDWLKPLIENSVKSCIMLEKGILEVILIVKVKCV